MPWLLEGCQVRLEVNASMHGFVSQLETTIELSANIADSRRSKSSAPKIVFSGRGKHTEMTSDITDCCCAHAHLPVGGDAEREGGRQTVRLG